MPIYSIMQDVVNHLDFMSRNQDTLMGVPSGFQSLDQLLEFVKEGQTTEARENRAREQRFQRETIAEVVQAEGQRVIGWRDVPVEPSAIGE